jgi:uncharacterized membrane protein
VFTTGQTSVFPVANLVSVVVSRAHEEAPAQFSRTRSQMFSRSEAKEMKTLLGMIAIVLIVLWLLGFFAFHVTTAFVHVALVIGLILLVLHLLRGSAASV